MLPGGCFTGNHCKGDANSSYYICIYALKCQVWLKLAKWFWRRSFFFNFVNVHDVYVYPLNSLISSGPWKICFTQGCFDMPRLVETSGEEDVKSLQTVDGQPSKQRDTGTSKHVVIHTCKSINRNSGKSI